MELTPELTSVEKYQSYRAEHASSPQNIDNARRYFLKASDLRQTLITNPYTSNAENLITGLFPNYKKEDIRIAATLAEPSGLYETTLAKFNRQEKREAYYREIDSSAEITMRLSSYVLGHANDLQNMPPEQAYSVLSKIAFGADDLNEISERYSCLQRRGFRLSIINFLEDREKLNQHRSSFEQDPKKVLRHLFSLDELNISLSDSVGIEAYPFSFVFYLSEDDYKKVNSLGSSSGVTRSSKYWPLELREKVVLINKGERDPEIVEKIKEHELLHVLQNGFTSETEKLGDIYDVGQAIEGITSGSFESVIKEFSSKIWQRTKDEIIAYAEREKFDLDVTTLDFGHWDIGLYFAKDYLRKADNLTQQAKDERFNAFLHARSQYLRDLREYRWMVKSLYEEANKGNFTKEKAEALLLNTPVNKTYRLERYLGLSPQEITEIKRQERQVVITEFSSNVRRAFDKSSSASSSTERFSLWTFDEIPHGLREKVKQTYYPELLPILTEAIQQSPNPYFLEDAIQAVTNICYSYPDDISSEQLQRLGIILEDISNNSNPQFKDVKKLAAQVLDNFISLKR